MSLFSGGGGNGAVGCGLTTFEGLATFGGGEGGGCDFGDLLAATRF